jgi:hypothetical protein
VPPLLSETEDDGESISRLEASVDAIYSFLATADTMRDRRADAAGPTLIRKLREIWSGSPKQAMRDIEEACERLLLPMPASTAGAPPALSPTLRAKRERGRGGGGGGGGGYRGDRNHGHGDDYQRERNGYNFGYTYASTQAGPPMSAFDAYYTSAPPRGPPPPLQHYVHPAQQYAPVPVAHQPAQPSASSARTADGIDRCVYCMGEHLSQRCYKQFPHLRPPPRDRL